MKKILKWIFGLLITLFIIVATVSTVLLLFTNDKGVVSIDRYSIVIMKDDNLNSNINKNDILLLKNIKLQDLFINDVISYIDTSTNTFKIGKVTSFDNNSSVQDSLIVNDESNNAIEVTEGNYIGRWTYKKVIYLGAILSIILTKTGFLLCIILPLLLLFVFEISKIVISSLKSKKSNDDNNINSNDKSNIDVIDENKVIDDLVNVNKSFDIVNSNNEDIIDIDNSINKVKSTDDDVIDVIDEVKDTNDDDDIEIL